MVWLSGKLTKYGRFIKTIKYAGYATSATVFTYELAEIFGAVPDQRYEELTQKIKTGNQADTSH